MTGKIRKKSGNLKISGYDSGQKIYFQYTILGVGGGGSIIKGKILEEKILSF